MVYPNILNTLFKNNGGLIPGLRSVDNGGI